MKLRVIFLLFSHSFFSLTVLSQTKVDSTSKKSDSLLSPSIITKEIVVVKGAVPTFKKDTLNDTKLVAKEIQKTNNITTVNPPSLNLVSIKEAGRINASLDVSATGGASYTIPITVAPGIGSMVPQLALVYSSQSGIGLAGVGWNMAGL